jgi:hypothetical protein
VRSDPKRTFAFFAMLFDRWNSYFPTWGEMAQALFLLVVVSGVALIIPYDLNGPDDSLQLISLFSAEALFFRSLHYWSAALLLVSTFIHTVEHLVRGHETRLRFSVWLRVGLLLLVLLYLMITGYILKGDSEGELARSIIEGLLATLPLLGDWLGRLLLGSDGYQTVYLHHAATATIIATLFIVEHARRMWPTAKGWVLSFFISLIPALLLPISVFTREPLLVKGPWYFLGVQELLHWTSRPVVMVIAMAIPILLLIWLPKMESKVARVIKAILLMVLPLYLLLSMFALFMRGDGWELSSFKHLNRYQMFGDVSLYQVAPTDSSNQEVAEVRGRREGCLNCHDEVEGLVAAHNPQVIGCASCHLGNTLSLVKEVAHQGMVLIPGNLAIADRTCGTTGCHGEIVGRVAKSLMGSGRGIVRANRKLFGEFVSPHALMRDNLSNLGSSNADHHLGQMCQRCHLGHSKDELGKITEDSRGGGCLACHLNYSAKSKEHPSLSIKVSDNHCFGCHSRSGRISTNFEGWHETKKRANKTFKESSEYRLVGSSKRVFSRQHADIHHQAGLACIDCHTATETMGDGKLYRHQREQLEVSCEDCHFKQQASTLGWQELSDEDRRILLIRYKDELKERRFLATKKGRRGLINTYLDMQGIPKLQGKISGKVHDLKAPATVCQGGKGEHSSLSCQSCHSAWVPQCISCHTQQDQDGRWIEYSGDFLAEPPTMGVKQVVGGGRKIVPVAPGMIMTLNQQASNLKKIDIELLAKKGSFHRRFVQVAPHTTMIKGRSCISCHCSPLALGLGRGGLVRSSEGSWDFLPEYGVLRDGLPADAWTSLFSQSLDLSFKDKALRPLNSSEQHLLLQLCQ